MERTLDLHYDTIVIGADLSALSFSYAQKIPFIYIRRLPPYKYGINKNYEEELDIYNKMFYSLAINNYCPLSDKIQSIRLENDNNLKITTNTNCLIKINFNNLFISDDYNLEGLPPIKSKTNYKNCVIDELGISDTYNIKISGDTGLNCPKTIFPTRTYVKRSKSYFNLYVNSIISDEELTKVEFSEGYIRLRLYRLFENMRTINHYKRTIYSLGKNLYDLPDNIKILTDEYKKILSMHHVEDKYLNFIESKIYGTNN